MAFKFLLMLLLLVPVFTTIVNAQADDIDDRVEDAVEGEDLDDDDEGDATVEGDSDTLDTDDSTLTDSDAKMEEEEEDETQLKPSPDADTQMLFTKPTTSTDLPAGVMVSFLVGFTNTGDKDFIVESLDASFRYPQDYSFYIQNFTTLRFDRVVEPEREATFQYAFTPNEAFSSRPFGLTINLNYKDIEGNEFQDAVFNETVNIVEADEGLDGETFFLYVLLAAVGVLLLVGAQQLLTSFGKKRMRKSRQQPVEMGTQGKGDIDYDWIPAETLNGYNKSPRSSPKQSPGRRRARKSDD